MADDDDGESWERFMILWAATPEIYIGSCIVALVCIISTIFVTINSKHSNSYKSKSTFDGKTSSKKQQSQLKSSTIPKHDVIVSTRNSSITCESQSWEDSTSPSLSKRTLYRFASEKLKESLTEEQLLEEKQIKRKQLAAICDLMKQQQELFGIDDIKQVEEQMKLYG